MVPLSTATVTLPGTTRGAAALLLVWLVLVPAGLAGDWLAADGVVLSPFARWEMP